MSRILFVTPPYTCWGVQTIGNWPPLQLAYLAGAARKAGHEAKIYDAMNKKTLVRRHPRARSRTFKPDFVMSPRLPAGHRRDQHRHRASRDSRPSAIAKEVNPEIVTLIGGPHPTFMYEEMLRDEDNTADFIVRGEAEDTLVDLMTRSRGQPRRRHGHRVPARRRGRRRHRAAAHRRTSTPSRSRGTCSTGRTTTTTSIPGAAWPRYSPLAVA